MPYFASPLPLFLGRAVWSAGAIVGPLTIIPKKHIEIRLTVGGYAGSGGIASLQVGNGSIDTGANYAAGLLEGATLNTTSVSVTGMRVAQTVITGPRLVVVRVTQFASMVKRFLIEHNSVSVSAATAPLIGNGSGIWVNTSALFNTIQFQAFTALTGTTTVNFLAGTEFEVWGRDDE